VGAPTALLDIRDLSVDYLTPGKGPTGAVRAVDGVSFAIAPGEVFGLAGESGSGKSTIAHSILRVLRPPAVITGGQILFTGRDVLEMGDDEIAQFQRTEASMLTRQDFAQESSSLEAFRWRDVAMVFQSALNALNPVMKISEQIMDVLTTHQRLSHRQARARAVELLEIVNIDPSRLDSYPHELSGGMRQRVVIAIALALHPPLLIMDEPTTALDVVVQKDIMQQIGRLKQQLGFSVLFITHDLSLMVEFSNRIGIMYAGQIVELAGAKEIFNNPLHPYTQGLLSSFPPLHGARRRLTGIPGSPPNMADPPPGCRFHPRCAICHPKETAALPQLREVLPGHWLRWHPGMPLPGVAVEAVEPNGEREKGQA
jgi:peptide/nickel transport system ATP-binding protein